MRLTDPVLSIPTWFRPPLSAPIRRRRPALSSIVGWGLLTLAVAYLWLFAFVSVLAIH